ncbi:uncharacterized protein LY79DRAFT_582461 [Colletotrichum navitas]|uniref:Uncharacterized protein n=1 Tax=Colletotrichum navitas TaxID=681940 RepID=A0AAD8PRQ3_9PEZI|nr:uncharacterized protein LY79DRAFT_582461 [Colletotrichum navitas]KAK1579529.1 hypothetical protein LY79DRAFT_582461 [Colletotrichum navitas]
MPNSNRFSSCFRSSDASRTDIDAKATDRPRPRCPNDLWGRSWGEVDRSPEPVHCQTLISQSITLHSTKFVSPLQSPGLCSADTKRPRSPERGRDVQRTGNWAPAQMDPAHSLSPCPSLLILPLSPPPSRFGGISRLNNGSWPQNTGPKGSTMEPA